MIRFACPTCSATLKAPDDKVGARSRCPHCGCAVVVPKLAEQPAPAAELKVVPEQPADDDDLVEMELVEETHPLVRLPEAAGAYGLNNAANAPRPRRVSRFIETTCSACSRPIRVRRCDQGKVQQCPRCRFFFKAPGRRFRGEESGLPVVLKICADIIVWPDCCACCLDLHDTKTRASHTDVDPNAISAAAWSYRFNPAYAAVRLGAGIQNRWWDIPYCWECIDHIDGKTDRHKPHCCINLDAAVEYKGLVGGKFHEFRFYNWQFANRLRVLNVDKCLVGR